MDVSQSSAVWMAALNEDSTSSFTKSNTVVRKSLGVTGAGSVPKVFEEHRDRESFYKDLYSYHDNKGTPIARPPRINGQEIDMHKLYKLVIGRGGWSKVNFRNEWEELVAEFDIPPKCVNASVAIKQIYMRYLDRYEKLHFMTEDNDRADDADDDNRHKKWNNKNLVNEVPLKYHYAQHTVSEGMRSILKMSTDLYKPTEYDRLLMSLMSPLPNEQDFAINVCTLMANESKHTLKIDTCPKLLEVLLGHAGVYAHFTLRVIFIEFYSKVRRNSLQAFWSDCLVDKPNILELCFDDHYESTDDKAETLSFDPPIESFEDGLNSGSTELDAFNDLDFLNLRRGLGTHDYIGQRVHQIASIIRNLTFIEDNHLTLVQNRTFLRFLVMCSNIRWGNLHHMALDMLGNVAPEIELSDPSADELTRSLMSTVSEGLESPDRGVIISCLEVLHKLCQKECNEDFLHKCMDAKTYNRICMYLSLNDIMLLLYTLECIYALTSMGEKSCMAILQVNGLIDQLVSLITVEAQSYGPDGCILMRVVETVPTNLVPSAHMPANTNGHSIHPMSNVQHANHFQHNLLPHTHPSFLEMHGQPTSSSFAVFSPPDVQKSHQGSATVAYQQPNQMQHPSPSTTPHMPPKKIIQSPTPPPLVQQNMQTQQSHANKPETSAPSTITTTPTKTTQNQAQQDNEQFALAWLRATFELVGTMATRIEQQDMYKMYLTASSKIGRIGVSSPLHFPRCVRSVFGNTVGPNQLKGAVQSDSPNLYYEGIRIRSKPLAVVYKGTILQGQVEMVQKKIEKPQPQPQHILQKVLSNQTGETLMVTTPVPIVGTSETSSSVSSTTSVSAVSNQQPQNTAVTSTQQSQPQLVSLPPTSSSMIKSLLANKVINNSSGTTEANQVAATNQQHIQFDAASKLIKTNVNVHQVAQRQQLQKQKELALQQQPSAQIASVTPPSTISEADSTNMKWDVPPLAPLSSNLNRSITISPPIEAATEETSILDEKSSGNNTNNQMLTDLLERKSVEPSFGDNTLKRKLSTLSNEDGQSESAAKRPTGVTDEQQSVNSSTSAANLYAKLAASLLEDEDMDEEEGEQINQTNIVQQIQQQPTTFIKQQQHEPQVISVPIPMQMQRQLIVAQNQQPQLIIQPANSSAQIPMLLQQSTIPGNFQLQKQIVMQQPSIIHQAQQQQQQGQTQYMLATNNQGQTYLVAQQPQQTQQQSQIQQQQQTVLVQGSGPNKTIYILQQPSGPVQAQAQQKVVMQAGGQPMVVTTQMPQQQQQQRPIQQQVFVNNQGTGNMIMPQTQQVPHMIGQTVVTSLSPQSQLVQKQQPPSVMQQQSQFGMQQQPAAQQQQQSQVAFQPIQSGGVIVGEKRVYLTQKNEVKNVPKNQQQRSQSVANIQKPQQQLPTKPQSNITTQKPPARQQTPGQTPNKPTANPTTKAKSKSPPVPMQVKTSEEPEDPNWLFVCDWRGCPRKNFRSANEVYLHTCQVHCPDNIDPNAEIYCQWGSGPNLCDNLPRKRFSLMTHLFDRHCTIESFKMGVQRRINTPPQPNAPTTPVTIIKNPTANASHSQSASPDVTGRTNSPTLTSSAGGSLPPASAAMQAIKRHALDFVNPKELMDENEGPVTKSIRLTAALILRNLVNYTTSAKRSLRFYEPHLAGVALSKVESSRTIAQVLFEMNESYAV